MTITGYQEKYKQDFIRLNRAWIEAYFTLEREDLEIMEHVEEYMEKGSEIFFALEEDNVMAVCMVVPLGNNVWEICKLAADDKYKGKGAGSAVLRACMDYAISQKAEKMIIISNTRLEPAMHLYRKFGFCEVPLRKELWGFERANIEFEFIVEKNGGK